MARATGAMIRQAIDLRDSGMTVDEIKKAVNCTNIGAYIAHREMLDAGIMPPDKGSAYSLPACHDYIENYRKLAPEPEAIDPDYPAADYMETLKVGIAHELGETARKAIDGLLKLLEVK